MKIWCKPINFDHNSLTFYQYKLSLMMRLNKSCEYLVSLYVAIQRIFSGRVVSMELKVDYKLILVLICIGRYQS